MKKKSTKALWVIILVISVAICLVCALWLVNYFFFEDTNPIERQPSSTAVTSPSETVANKTEKTATKKENTEPATERFKETTTTLPENDSVDFKELMEINPDIYAWIYIPNTNVDYPVAQSGKDNDDSFYLSHNVYKNYQFSGTIYSEKKNARDFSDPVTVLYGHNMLNGSMFASLHNFSDKEFFDNNNTMFIFTKDKVLTYLIYSAYQYDDRHILNSFDMTDNTSLRLYLDTTLTQRPYYCNIREGVELTTDDHIVTLSTCMPGGGNVRYLVQGVLVNEEDA